MMTSFLNLNNSNSEYKYFSSKYKNEFLLKSSNKISSFVNSQHENKKNSSLKTQLKVLKNALKLSDSFKFGLQYSSCAFSLGKSKSTNTYRNDNATTLSRNEIEDYLINLINYDNLNNQSSKLLKYLMKKALIELRIREASEKMIDCYLNKNTNKISKKCIKALKFHCVASSALLRALYFKLMQFGLNHEFEIYYHDNLIDMKASSSKILNEISNDQLNDEINFSVTLPEDKFPNEFVKFEDQKLNLRLMKPLKLLGTGNFGQVLLVGVKNKGVYALKKLMKKTYEKDQCRKIYLERKILVLATLYKNPFLIHIYGAFQTHKYLYILMECATRGTLKHVINAYRTLNKSTIRFYAACCVLGLQFLHSFDIIHRGKYFFLKPKSHIKFLI